MPSASASSAGLDGWAAAAMPTPSDLKNLLAVVLATCRTRSVRQLGLTARAVRAGDQVRRTGLPLRPARAGVAARHLALRNGHFGNSSTRTILSRRRISRWAPPPWGRACRARDLQGVRPGAARR